MNYRNQWPAIDANFTTFSAFGDFYIEDKNSGVGFIVNHDHAGNIGTYINEFGFTIFL